jgi:hypothetical protein
MSKTSENTVLLKALSRILGCALFLCGSTAFAFTLILPPQEQLSPGNTITDPLTLESQVQPIAGTIRTQLLSHRRPKGAERVSQVGRMLAANAYASSRSDVEYLAAAPSGSSGAGSGSGPGNSESWWISAASNSLENEFSRTAFYGATHNLLVGFDLTRSDRYILGLSVGHEASNFTTTFNTGDERTRGFNINPYFALLLTETWSVDLILGYGDFNTSQSRTIAVAGIPPVTSAVNSEFDSTRGFVSANLTNVSTWGNWRLTGSLGALASQRKQEAYVESNGNAVPSAESGTVEQWNLLGEAAYGRGNSEAFFGAMYENTRDPLQITFASGEQPANDPDSVLLSAGWRYFGRGLTANFMFSSRVAQEQVKEYGFSMMLRVDL